MTVETASPVPATTGAAPGRTEAPGTAEPERPAEATPGLISLADWRSPGIRRRVRLVHGAMLILLVVWGLFPLLWLAKASITPTQETIKNPLQLWPSTPDWDNLHFAWFKLNLALYFKNTVVIAVGSWLTQLFIATTAGFVLSVLKPAYAKLLNALVVATLFIPSVVLLIPLYLTIQRLPVIHTSLMNQYWAIWLPAGASAFNVLLVKRFFDNLPREIFEAAHVDGAGPLRLFWSIVLPMSKPILGVVSLFAFISAWRDFLWPYLVLQKTQLQPLSVRLNLLQRSHTEYDVFLAALFLSTLLPVVLFLMFQRFFLRGSGLSGALKG
ncbi:MAG: carbohydrate ABC transporter permease [Mycobacteriales bacterium]